MSRTPGLCRGRSVCWDTQIAASGVREARRYGGGEVTTATSASTEINFITNIYARCSLRIHFVVNSALVVERSLLGRDVNVCVSG